MTTRDIVYASRVTLHIQRTDPSTLEDAQFGYSIHQRESGADEDDVITAAVDHWSQLMADSIVGGCTLVAVSISNWNVFPGFTGWHQVRREPQFLALNGVNVLPQQLAIVHSLLNQSELGIAVGRRRGRTYLGYLPQSDMDSQGYVAAAKATVIKTAHTDFHDQLVGYGHGGIPSGLEGLCIASPTEQVIMNAEVQSVGKSIDTHRSRREHSPEAHVYTAIT